MVPEWPVYYRKDLVVGSADSSVAVCTLWSERDRIARFLDPSTYAVVGNLYSLWGLGFLLRNVLARPSIRQIVLCGADQTASGQALVNLVNLGLDAGGQVVDSAARIDPAIPREAVELFRRSVSIVDVRPTIDPQVVAAAIAGLPRLPAFAEPQLFPDPAPRAQVLPSERTGFKTDGAKVAEVWLRVLRLVMDFGTTKPSEYTSDQKELLNVTAVVTDEHPDDIDFAPWLPFSREQLENYYPRVLSGEPIPGVSYTYGGRLRDYRGAGHDQIAAMIERLRRTTHTRRAVAVTWDPLIDGESDHPPCLIHLLTSIQEERLYLTAQFRSHDVFGAWPENVFALRKLQDEIARGVGVALGPLTIISHSAHVYADRWDTARELLERHYPKTVAWRDDQRGNFHFSIEDGKLVAEHATTLTGLTGRRFVGRTARQVYLAVVNANLISLPEHAAYLGAELQKAELALALGLPYTQDRRLDLERARQQLSVHEWAAGQDDGPGDS